MLQEGFLEKLSEWACATALNDEHARAGAEKKFGLHRLTHSAEDPEKIAALFSEWLTFDFKHQIFNNGSALEEFIKSNPLQLPEQEVSAYKDLRSFEVGLFEVKNIEPGRGVLLCSLVSGATHFVNILSMSRSVKADDIVWTRIAVVNGEHHTIGALFFVLPVAILSGMRGVIATWKPNSFDARAVADLIANDNPQSDHGATENEEENLSLREAERRFIKALKQCGMDGFFSLRTFKRWCTNEKKYDLLFASRALFFLAPETTREDTGAALAKAAVDLANRFPRKELGGASPSDFRESNPQSEQKLQMETYSRDTYAELNAEALRLMHQGKYENAYRVYEGLAQKLLDERTPLFGAFRMYANAAVCCFHGKDELNPLGEPLLDAALRLNTLYDFGLHLREYYVRPQNGFSEIPKKDRRLAKTLQVIFQRLGTDKYRRTPFRKYERFLTDCGITLRYKTKTTPTVWRTDEKGKQIKIGRNDPCYCNSGKKYKKCCGG